MNWLVNDLIVHRSSQNGKHNPAAIEVLIMTIHACATASFPLPTDDLFRNCTMFDELCRQVNEFSIQYSNGDWLLKIDDELFVASNNLIRKLYYVCPF